MSLKLGTMGKVARCIVTFHGAMREELGFYYPRWMLEQLFIRMRGQTRSRDRE